MVSTAGNTLASPGSDPVTPVRPSEEFLIFGAPLICDEEEREILSSLRTGWLGTGPKVAQLEREFRDYKGAQYAVAVNSCTAALHLSMLAAGIGAGDEVITTALTFCATVNTIIHAGAKPVLVDVDPVTFNLDVKEVEARLKNRKKAILPVHFAGRPCDMDALVRIAEAREITLIEDCAHAIETL